MNDEEGNYKTTKFPSILQILTEELKILTPGLDDAKNFHWIIPYILKIIFSKQLTEMEIETDEINGMERIDITFLRKNTPGFFKDLFEVHNIKCNYIKIECKNYSSDPGNPEYDQLSNRLHDDTGFFGFLIVRNISDSQNALNHCIFRKNKHKHYILILEDNDIIQMVNFKVLIREKEIDELLQKKLKNLLFERLT